MNDFRTQRGELPSSSAAAAPWERQQRAYHVAEAARARLGLLLRTTGHRVHATVCHYLAVVAPGTPAAFKVEVGAASLHCELQLRGWHVNGTPFNDTDTAFADRLCLSLDVLVAEAAAHTAERAADGGCRQS